MCYNQTRSVSLYNQYDWSFNQPYLHRVGVIQVGTRPREGNYGACFYENLEASNVVVYSARPGCRVWEVSVCCDVILYHVILVGMDYWQGCKDPQV